MAYKLLLHISQCAYIWNCFLLALFQYYNRRIISLGQSSRPYKNTSTPYIASFSALPFPHRSMLTTKLSWAKHIIVPQYTTLSGGGGGWRGSVWGVKLHAVTKRHRKLFVWCIIVPMNWSMIVVCKSLNGKTCQYSNNISFKKTKKALVSQPVILKRVRH
jgi:hypothetical protein